MQSLTNVLFRTEDEVAEVLYEVMRQFYILFPEMTVQDLYVTGESYGGTIVMHSELSTTTLYHISNLQTPLRYSWYSSAAAETCLLLRVTAVHERCF